VKHIFALSLLASAALALGADRTLANPSQDPSPRLTVRATIAKMKATWESVRTYECTVAVHEAKGDSVQDRTYLVRFEKPTQTRVDIVNGDGRGTAAIWNGGDRVKGHQGGILSIIRLNVGLHSKLATDLRGSTIAEANFGSLIAHLESLDPTTERVTKSAGRVVLVVEPDPPSPDNDVTKEVYILAPNWLPLEFYEYAEDRVVRHVINSRLKLNIDITASTWQL
jgi:phage baseplate assembly protein W